MAKKWVAKVTDNYFITYDRETDEIYVHHYEDGDEMMTNVSRIYAFNDCEYVSIEVYDIVYHNKELEYVGWQPNMRYEFLPTDGTLDGWCGYFPSWEH